MAKLKIAHLNGSTLVDQKVRGVDADSVQPGGTGGPGSTITSTGAATINVVYRNSANAAVSSGYIVAQKGAHKFLVANTANAGTALTTITLANVTGNTSTVLAGLTASQGVITFYPPTGSGNTQVAATRITNKFVYTFAGSKYRYKLGGNATATYGNVSSS